MKPYCLSLHPSLASCVVSDELLNISFPQILHMQNTDDNNSTYSTGLFCGLNDYV